jgi:hypothetical protein
MRPSRWDSCHQPPTKWEESWLKTTLALGKSSVIVTCSCLMQHLASLMFGFSRACKLLFCALLGNPRALHTIDTRPISLAGALASFLFTNIKSHIITMSSVHVAIFCWIYWWDRGVVDSLCFDKALLQYRWQIIDQLWKMVGFGSLHLLMLSWSHVRASSVFGHPRQPCKCMIPHSTVLYQHN